MSNKILNSIDEIKKYVEENDKILIENNKEIEKLKQKCKDYEDELTNLNKVSLVASLTRKIDEKNNMINLLERQLEKYKTNSNKTVKKKTLEVDDSENEEDIVKKLEGFEIIKYENFELLKDIETKKLYYYSNGKKGEYAGKEKKNGKIRLKS
jgi:predicted RNase H-like nuclease (RuvC/YqgF family)